MRPLRMAPLLSALTFSALLFLSCNKETSQSSDELTPEQEQSVATLSTSSEAEAEATFDDVFNNVIGVNDEVGMAGVGVFGAAAPGGGSPESGRTDSAGRCFTVTITRLNQPEPFPLRVVIDFGSGCVGRDGRLRKGKIITEYTGRLVVPGKSATTTFDNYSVDTVKVEGQHKIANTSTSASLQFTIDVTNGKLTRPNGNYSEWNSHKVKTQIEGLGTPFFPVDDVFRIEGSARGRVKHGTILAAWVSEITTPLIRRFNCRWIVKGVIASRRQTLPAGSPWTAQLNFGDGSCDNQASLTINGIAHQITLH